MGCNPDLVGNGLGESADGLEVGVAGDIGIVVVFSVFYPEGGFGFRRGLE